MEKFENIFLGIGWKFPPSFVKSQGEIIMVNNEENIHNSLSVLIATLPGERILQPEYGCDLTDFLFEGIDVSFHKRMADRIEQSIIKFEPRVKVLKIEFEDLLYKEGKIEVQVHYEIKATNSRHNLVYPFYIEEGHVKP